MENEYEPVIGDGATYYIGSDAFPATIVEVKANGRVVIRQDNYKLVKGDCAGVVTQEYEYSPDAEGTLYTCYKNKRGRWMVRGEKRPVSLGHRRRYYDPSF